MNGTIPRKWSDRPRTCEDKAAMREEIDAQIEFTANIQEWYDNLSGYARAAADLWFETEDFSLIFPYWPPLVARGAKRFIDEQVEYAGRRGLTDFEVMMRWRMWDNWYKALSENEQTAFNALPKVQQLQKLYAVQRKSNAAERRLNKERVAN